MDVMSAASTLRSQLVALHNSDTTVSQIENSITTLRQQTVTSAIEDNQSHHLRQVLRLSVSEGVCSMYRQFSNRKWTEVQSTVSSIKSSLEPATSEQTSQDIVTSSPTRGSTSQDTASSIWTSVFCECSRCD